MAVNVTQVPVEVLQSGQAAARVSQLVVHVAYKSTSQQTRVSQAPIHLATAVHIVPVILPQVLPFLFIPQGQGQSVDELTGASSIAEMEAYCIDPNNILKKLLADPTFLGTKAEFRLGFPSMNLSDFVVLSTHQLIRAGTTPDGTVVYSLQDTQRFTKLYIWSEGGPSAWLPGYPTPPTPKGVAFASNGLPVSDDNPRYIQGNPMDLLLVACQNELGIGQTDPGDPSTWSLYEPGDDSTLINPNLYLDVDSIIALRDGQFSGDWLEFVIKAQEEGKQWIEGQILKTCGLYWVALSSGVLTLKSMKSPESLTGSTWTQNSIMGIPQLDRWDILNILQARMNVDDTVNQTASRIFEGEVEYRDAVSIDQFRGMEMIQQIELTGLRSRRGGSGRAFILADRIFRRHGYGTPTYQPRVQLRNLPTELGEIIFLTHPIVVELDTSVPTFGTFGFNAVPCEVIDRQPNYTEGYFDYTVIDLRFTQLTTKYEIAGAGIPDWTSASTQEKATYLFITNDSGKMSDGVDGNRIF